MFADNQMFGIDFGIPDVCLTPPVAVPIPYPNFGFGPLGFPAAYNILIDCMPAHNMMTEVMLTVGDQPGLMLGVASGMVMGPVRHLTGAFTCLFDGMPVTRLTSINIQNMTNCPGMRIVPSQFNVLVLSP